MDTRGIIYKYTSPNGKVYIGQTTNEKNRIYQHKSLTVKSRNKFGSALRKYGFENFKYEVIVEIEGDTKYVSSELNRLEAEYIKIYDSWKKGYNSTTGGESPIRLEPKIRLENESKAYGKFLDKLDMYYERKKDEWYKYDQYWETCQFVNTQDLNLSYTQ